MITPNGKLEILEQFKVDRQLPKFLKKLKRSGQHSKLVIEDEDWGVGGDVVMMTRPDSFVVTSGGQVSPPPKPWWRRLLDLLWGGAPVKPAEPKPTMTVAEFFSSVQNTAEELQLVEARLAGYSKALREAERTGQVALRERLAKDVEAVRAETQLVAVGLTKYVSEATLVDFVKKCPKGLRLDYVRNFMRVIPDDVITKKVRCDDIGVFDNYAVLHYDPERKSWAETEEERNRRKDPILFGLISGRRQLYFVGDWVDEYCDLTLEQIADILGKDAISEVPHSYEVPA